MNTSTPNPDATIVDAADIRARFEEDPDLMREIIDLFLTDYRERLMAIQSALDRQDAADLHLQAHSLKGSAGAIGAGRVAAAAATVEHLARDGALEDAAPACLTVEEQLIQIVPVLSALIETHPSGAAAA